MRIARRKNVEKLCLLTSSGMQGSSMEVYGRIHTEAPQ